MKDNVNPPNNRSRSQSSNQDASGGSKKNQLNSYKTDKKAMKRQGEEGVHT